MQFEKLREVRDAYKARKELEQKIKEFESMRLSPRATAYGAERVQSSPKGDVQPDTLAKLDGMLERYNAKLQKVCDLIAEFEDALSVLTLREQTILRLYYVDCMTWEQVCVKEHVSWTRLHEIRRNAIATICPDFQPRRERNNKKTV